MKSVLLAVLIAACGGGHSAPSRPVASAGAHPAAPAAQAASPDARECDELIAHAVDLAAAERRSAKPAEPAPTDDDRHAVERDVRAQLAAGCTSLPRAHYACAMQATTLDALTACDR